MGERRSREHELEDIVAAMLDEWQEQGEPDSEQVWCPKRWRPGTPCGCEDFIRVLKRGCAVVGRKPWWQEPTARDLGFEPSKETARYSDICSSCGVEYHPESHGEDRACCSNCDHETSAAEGRA